MFSTIGSFTWPKTAEKHYRKQKNNKEKETPWPANNRHSQIREKLQRPSTLLITCIALL
jgi:hypothetical protein